MRFMVTSSWLFSCGVVTFTIIVIVMAVVRRRAHRSRFLRVWIFTSSQNELTTTTTKM